MQKINLIILVFVAFFITNCKDPYKVELRPTDQSLLVVEGFLNIGNTTTFRLSRTVNLYDNVSYEGELNAYLTVEGKDNTIGHLIDKGSGVYETYLPFLEVGKEYRLRIHTSDGKEYLSDFVAIKNNPAIDSVSWKQQQNDDVHIYVSTHDPENKTRYYRWEFDETWEIRSNYFSSFKWGTRPNGDPIVLNRILPREDVSVCWKYHSSTNLLLGSSAKLSTDVIKENPLLLIPRISERLERRYSILVRQYTMSKEAYEYYEQLKKNTESLGSIFDPLPSEIKGNIHCVSNPKEQVVGFITASAVQEKRIFISSNELKGRGSFLYCEEVQIPDITDSLKFYRDYEPYDVTTNSSGGILWLASSAQCVDCNTRGGSTRKPTYW